jgi:serine/threonine protein kinase
MKCKLGRDVAIKVLREERTADPERLRRFEQEARSASALNHPNIVTIHDIGKRETTPYIAMEYVEGKTLREILSGGYVEVCRCFRQGSTVAH